MGNLLQILLTFVLTIVVGTRIAHVWQARAAKEARFFEASRDIYSQMVAAADNLSDLAGRRIYATQRVCLTKPASPHYHDAEASFRAAVIEWNQKLLSMELSVRTKFRDSYLATFEYLQSDLSSITADVERLLAGNGSVSRSIVLRSLRGLRARYFEFVQGMMREARILHRQMHFGVVIQYNSYEITKMSTYNLVKALFTTRVEGESIVRSPSDFGLPVGAAEARFGIYE